MCAETRADVLASSRSESVAPLNIAQNGQPKAFRRRARSPSLVEPPTPSLVESDDEDLYEDRHGERTEGRQSHTTVHQSGQRAGAVNAESPEFREPTAATSKVGYMKPPVSQNERLRPRSPGLYDSTVEDEIQYSQAKNTPGGKIKRPAPQDVNHSGTRNIENARPAFLDPKADPIGLRPDLSGKPERVHNIGDTFERSEMSGNFERSNRLDEDPIEREWRKMEETGVDGDYRAKADRPASPRLRLADSTGELLYRPVCRARAKPV